MMRAAIYQCAGAGLTPHERLTKLSGAIATKQFDLVVCPELFMSGYNVGSDISRLAEPIDGEFGKQISELAQHCHTAIVYGYPERHGGLLYNSAAAVSSNGSIAANHRKMFLPPGFEGDYFTPGDRPPIFDLCGMRCGILICYDAEFPESVRLLSIAGAEVIIVPTALGDQWSSVAHRLIPTRAFENGVWLLYANHAGIEDEATYLGASCIVAPDGNDAARAGAEEELISASLCREQILQARTRIPYLQDIRQLPAIM